MGGQACELYGAAEFSRDMDLAIVADPRNLSRLRKALADLEAETIATPPFHQSYLVAAAWELVGSRGISTFFVLK